MLPDRSKRYAGIDGEIPRLGLSSNGQLLVIALLVLALLVMIFPRTELVEKLYEHEALDDLTLSYIQNLYRANPGNVDVALLLARTQQDQLDLESLEDLLLPPATAGDPRQRTQARIILVKAYAHALDVRKDRAQPAQLKLRVTALMRTAVKDAMPERLARAFADLAYSQNLPDLGAQFSAKVETGQSASALEHYALEALARQNYALASEYYLMARDQTANTREAHRLFRAGVDALMADSQFPAAMRAARQHLGALSNDAPTLRYLARTALAAGDPVQAAAYAKALVFTTPTASP